LLFFFYF